MMKTCPACKKEQPADKEHFYFQYGRPHGHCKECQRSPEERAYRRQYMQNLRVIALCRYGGTPPKCRCCGETTVEFLAMDHIDGGGNKHRKELVKTGLTIYLWLRKMKYPAGFQVLCHNCNLAKGYYGQCPHTQTKAA